MLEYILFVFSLILYFVAPDDYQWSFCALCCGVFLLGSFFAIKPSLKKKELLSFNVIFLFSYFWTSFAYPLLIYGTFRDRANYINEYINWDNLSHTSAVALVFICSYFVGYSYTIKKVKSNRPYSFSLATLNVQSLFFGFISILYITSILFSFIVTGKVNLSFGVFLTDIYFTLLVFVLYVNVNNNQHCYHGLKNFIKINKYPLIISVILFSISVIVGDRGPAIKTILILFSVYYFFWNKIKVKRLVIYGLFFLCLLFFVRQTRSSENNIVSGGVSIESVKNVFTLENGILYLFADLFYINRELCVGYEYYRSHDLYYPEKILIAPLYPIPLLPSFISNVFFSVTPAEMETGKKLNDIMLNDYTVESNFGNHCAGDLIMSFGLLGLVILSYIFGRVVSYFNQTKYNHPYSACGFIILLSWSLYMPRSVILSIIRPLGYIFIFGNMLLKIKNKLKRDDKLHTCNFS